MDHDTDLDRQRRETVLTVLLSLLGAFGILFFLVLITGGLLLWLVVGVVAVAALGLLNYLLWGRWLSRATAGEREEAQMWGQLDVNEWDLPDPRRPRHD
jgi:hypothetical protein